MERYLYSELASLVIARTNCETNKNDEWFSKHEDRIEELVREHLPSGSGFDSGTTIDLDESRGEKLIFRTHYHHMNDGGYYSGWTYHTITVIPSLAFGFHLRVSGRNQNDIKDYVHDCFSESLHKTICSLCLEHHDADDATVCRSNRTRAQADAVANPQPQDNA